MLQLSLKSSENSEHGKADMYVDYQDECIGFTVLTEDKKQYYFSFDRDDWDKFKDFIEEGMRQEDRQKVQPSKP